ncbi:hypothetical protein K504DRAFT_434913 [Pleomassaria siparia CBS 279.74]|uniref:DUF7587 domain-containing protein n=1 Tax=Pleomassaria siparia CBS 279.74 TaxID=1314801 RepID=A0A6G1K733_9PLEO|nr:hypothetical protein K504DRAFT_434913 [Pleomassaria siparia CBS 279.74]
MQSTRSGSLSSTASDYSTTPTQIPARVYRVNRPGSQTRYSYGTGFSAKNHTTILNSPFLVERFGNAHLSEQTNISSPLISVYDDLAHAECVAHYLAKKHGEKTMVVTIDTSRWARGPVFRAVNILKDRELTAEERFLHQGEYMVMYNIPREAIVTQTPVGHGADAQWKGVGVIGGGRR